MGAEPANTMTPRALAREMWRDITTGTAWTGIWTLIVAAVLIAGVGIDLLALGRETAAAQHYRDSLSSVHVIEAHGRIDAASCQALSRIPAVRGAIALRAIERGMRADAMPSTRLQTWEVAGDAAAVLTIAGETTGTTDPATVGGVILSEQVARDLGATPGEAISLDGAQGTVSNVYSWDENDGRRTGFAYAVLVPVPAAGAFDECWVNAWPLNSAIDALMRMSVIPSGGEQSQASSSQVNTSLGTGFDGPARYAKRLTRPMVWAMSGLLAVIGTLVVRRRRLEFASDLHAGVSRADLMLKILAQNCTVAAAACLLTIPAVTAIILRVPAGDRAALWTLAGLEAAVAVGVFLLAGLAATWVLRENRLFAYFKAR